MALTYLYHGSQTAVSAPSVEKCKPHNDYGRGFYCTQSEELAKEWACQEGIDGFANKYAIDLEKLDIIDLNSEPYNILHWLTILLENRIFDIAAPIMLEGAEWLRENFHVDTSHADVIKGYRADDSYFQFARTFLQNTITLEQLSRAMRLGELGEQYVLKSRQAFDSMQFISALPAGSAVYWPHRSARDSKARADFKAILQEPRTSTKGKAGSRTQRIYISTLMDMEEDELDACLR